MGRCQWLLVMANIFVVICNINSLNEATDNHNGFNGLESSSLPTKSQTSAHNSHDNSDSSVSNKVLRDTRIGKMNEPTSVNDLQHNYDPMAPTNQIKFSRLFNKYRIEAGILNNGDNRNGNNGGDLLALENERGSVNDLQHSYEPMALTNQINFSKLFNKFRIEAGIPSSSDNRNGINGEPLTVLENEPKDAKLFSNHEKQTQHSSNTIVGSVPKESGTSKANLNSETESDSSQKQGYMLLSRDGSELINPNLVIRPGEDVGKFKDKMILGKQMAKKQAGGYSYTDTDDKPEIKCRQEWEEKPHLKLDAWRSTLRIAFKRVINQMRVDFTVTEEIMIDWPSRIDSGVYPMFYTSAQVFETQRAVGKQPAFGKLVYLKKRGYEFYVKFRYGDGLVKNVVKESGIWKRKANQMWEGVVKEKEIYLEMKCRTFEGDHLFLHVDVQVNKSPDS